MVDQSEESARLSTANDQRPVSFNEAVQYLDRRFMMDEEWQLFGEDELLWWPGPLPQHLRVQATWQVGDDADRDALLLLRATTDVFYVADEGLGCEVANSLNRGFHFGAFVWADDVVRATASLAWNPQCRGLIGQFSDSCLQQATRANQAAFAYLGIETAITPVPQSAIPHDDRITVCERPHPKNGMRYDPDEILTIFSGDRLSIPVASDFAECLATARTAYRTALLEAGFEPRGEADGGERFVADDIDVLMQHVTTGPDCDKYGPGLLLRAPLSPPTGAVASDVVNSANLVIEGTERWSQLGPVEYDQERFGWHIRSMLDYSFLAEQRHSPSRLAENVANGVVHCQAAGRALLDS